MCKSQLLLVIAEVFSLGHMMNNLRSTREFSNSHNSRHCSAKKSAMDIAGIVFTDFKETFATILIFDFHVHYMILRFLLTSSITQQNIDNINVHRARDRKNCILAHEKDSIIADDAFDAFLSPTMHLCIRGECYNYIFRVKENCLNVIIIMKSQ